MPNQMHWLECVEWKSEVVLRDIRFDFSQFAIGVDPSWSYDFNCDGAITISDPGYPR